jgi:hypothetical protein
VLFKNVVFFCCLALFPIFNIYQPFIFKGLRKRERES